MAQKFFDNKDFLSPPNGDRLKIFFFPSLHFVLCISYIKDGWMTPLGPTLENGERIKIYFP